MLYYVYCIRCDTTSFEIEREVGECVRVILDVRL